MLAAVIVIVGLIVTLMVVPLIWAYSPRLLRWTDQRVASETDRADAATFRVQAKQTRAALAPLLATVTVVAGGFATVYQFVVVQRAEGNREASKVFLAGLQLIQEKNSDMTQRTGAIYALANVMDHDPRSHSAVIRTLLTFIRQRRSRVAHHDCKLISVSAQPDIQAAINVIGRADRAWRQSEDEGMLDFQRLCLFGASFRDLNLAGANFEQSDLRRTNFDGASVTDANFTTTNFDYVSAGASEAERTLDGFLAITRDASYRMYQLIALFRQANAAGAHFEGACLRGVDFSDTDLSPALENQQRDDNFNDAGISLANFQRVKGLSFPENLHLACATQSALNTPQGAAALDCPENDGGFGNPEKLGTQRPLDRCLRDIFVEIVPPVSSSDDQ